MKVKTLLLTGAIALVVIGCVIAAGCTSSTTQQTSSGDLNDVAGNWFGKYTFDGTTYDVLQIIKPDSTGYWAMIDESRVYDVYTSAFSNFDGNGHFDKKSSNGNTYKMTYADSTLTEDLGNGAGTIVYTRVDPIGGIWFDEGTDVVTKKLAKFTHVFKADGTGFNLISNDDGTTNLVVFTWKKNDDGTYTLLYADGFSNTWNVDQDTVTISTGDNTFVAKRMFTNANNVIMVLGSWYNPENSALLFFNADGTYSLIRNKETIQEGTWSTSEFGKLAIHIEKGTNLDGKDVAGEDRTWTYDGAKDTITVQNGNVYARPSESVADFTLTRFSTEPIAGIWCREGIDTISEKSAKVTHVIETDGTANLYVEYDDGTTANAELTWVKNADGTYTLSYPNGVEVDWTLDKTGMNASTSIDKDTRYTHTKVTDPSYPLWSYMLGPWYNDVWSNKPLFFLNADGTYSMYRTNSDSQTMEEIGNGTWEILEPGKIVQHINKGTVPSTGEDLSGLDITWTYDSVNNTFNEEEHGLKQVRPSEDVGSHHVYNFD